MPTLREIGEQYGVSKSTARRWVESCMPEVLNGSVVNLNDSQMHQLAKYVSDSELVTIREDSKKSDLRTVHESSSEAFVNDSLERLHELEIENASLRAKNDSLKWENDLLLERLKVADEALEREQQMARGFWNRLGQKLLPSRRSNKDEG